MRHCIDLFTSSYNYIVYKDITVIKFLCHRGLMYWDFVLAVDDNRYCYHVTDKRAVQEFIKFHKSDNVPTYSDQIKFYLSIINKYNLQPIKRSK